MLTGEKIPDTPAAIVGAEDRLHTVELIFKGGAKTLVKVSDFTLTTGGGEIQEVKWVHGGSDRILTILPDELAAVIVRGDT